MFERNARLASEGYKTGEKQFSSLEGSTIDKRFSPFPSLTHAGWMMGDEGRFLGKTRDLRKKDGKGKGVDLTTKNEGALSGFIWVRLIPHA